MPRWTDKVVLITGGSAGLGRAIAQAFAAAGARVMIVGRDPQRLDEAVAAMTAAGLKVLGRRADITSPQDVRELLDHVTATCGRLDVLVNCAGRSSRGLISETPPERFAELLELNFIATVRCTQAALPLLIASRGHVVNIGSLATKTASPYLGAYSASKFPLAAFSQQLRLEYSAQGVHTLLVCPGPIRRDDAGARYDAESAGLPDTARRPGAGVKLSGIDPHALAAKIVHACERRRPELIVPGRAKLMFAVAQLWPTLGDWILRRMT
jgi:uncharacterized protein